jgi:hypothetical protein
VDGLGSRGRFRDTVVGAGTGAGASTTTDA